MSNEIGTRTESVEARTIRKVRIRIIPFIFLFYIVAYLDRTNIGFAALTMNKELGITSQQFGLLAGIFFFGYFIFEVPSNLLLHKIGARIWIARILITWGIVAMLTGFVHNVHQLYAVRFLLGLAEAGYYPGVVLYLTYWFRQREQAQAIALVLVGIPVTSILGGPVSGFILDHVRWLEVSSWRWLLILEGVPAVVCGVLAYFLLPSRPTEARFLAQNEKDWIITELAREHEKKLGEDQISLAKTFTHLRVWHLVSIEFTYLIGLYSLSFWLPQVIKSLSSYYSNTLVGLLAVIPQLVGLASMVLVSRSSDRRLERRYHAAISALAGGIGWLLLGTTTSPVVSILLLSLVAAGIYSMFGPFWSLPSEFLTAYAAASGIAFINSTGNLGGFAGPYAIGLIEDKTGSLHWGLAFVGISMLVSAMSLMLLPKRPHPICLAFPGPRTDDSHPTGNAVRCRNLSLKPV
jgi:MFS transporter, ACS family, tartrate transporter